MRTIPLGQALKTADWSPPPPDPGFRPSVWKRIEAESRGASWPASLRAHARAWAAAALTVTLVSGWAGHQQAKAKMAEDRGRLLAHYLADIDPHGLASAQAHRAHR